MYENIKVLTSSTESSLLANRSDLEASFCQIINYILSPLIIVRCWI